MTRDQMRRLLEHSQAEPGERFVLAVIALHAGQDGSAFPSVDTLARITGYSSRQVRRYIAALAQRGTELSIPNPSRGRRAHRFHLRLPNPDSVSGMNPDNVSGFETSPPAPEPGHPRPSTLTMATANPDTHVRARGLKGLKEKRGRPARVRTRRRSAPETEWPEGFTLTADLRAYAIRRGCQDPDLGFEHFRNDALARGRRHQLWSAAFKKWMDNHERYGCPCQKNRGAASGRWEDLV